MLAGTGWTSRAVTAHVHLVNLIELARSVACQDTRQTRGESGTDDEDNTAFAGLGIEIEQRAHRGQTVRRRHDMTTISQSLPRHGWLLAGGHRKEHDIRDLGPGADLRSGSEGPGYVALASSVRVADEYRVDVVARYEVARGACADGAKSTDEDAHRFTDQSLAQVGATQLAPPAGLRRRAASAA